jgi:hypothetical protein
VDENLLAIGHALAAVREDVVFPGHRDLPEVPTGTPDQDWLRVIGREGLDLVLLTRDQEIRKKPGELAALKTCRVRAVFLVGKEDMTRWDKLTLIVKSWDRLERAITKNGVGPWALAMTPGRLKDIPL